MADRAATRIERDSFGPIEVAADRYWGAQTQRSVELFRIGDERIPEMKAFHDEIAPLNNAHRITSPLFVAQGYNDPRVPYTEAEQIVKAVRGNGGVVWYLMFNDEGHGFRKKANADFFSAATMQFWQQHLIDAP